MLNSQDIKKVQEFETNVRLINQILWGASESDIKKFFNDQDALLNSIDDTATRDKLLLECKQLRIVALGNNIKHNATLVKIKELTLNDGMLPSSVSKLESIKYFDELEKEIQALPTDEETKLKLMGLSSQYRLVNFTNL